MEYTTVGNIVVDKDSKYKSNLISGEMLKKIKDWITLQPATEISTQKYQFYKHLLLSLIEFSE